VDVRDEIDDAEDPAFQPARVSSIESRRRREPLEAIQQPELDRGRRVLVVEDERTIRHSIAGYLQDAGYTVDEAENGADALNRMRDALPDVVVLDLLMPIMGGRAFVQACRQDVRLGAVPVVLLSAAHDLAQATEQLQPRASLAKPVDLDVLLAVVDRVSHS
jgi:CheY-like chemotaxis protein